MTKIIVGSIPNPNFIGDKQYDPNQSQRFYPAFQMDDGAKLNAITVLEDVDFAPEQVKASRVGLHYSEAGFYGCINGREVKKTEHASTIGKTITDNGAALHWNGREFTCWKDGRANLVTAAKSVVIFDKMMFANGIQYNR